MPSAGFESVIPANKQLQTYALDRTVTGIGCFAVPTIVLLSHLFTPHILYFILELLAYQCFHVSFLLGDSHLLGCYIV